MKTSEKEYWNRKTPRYTRIYDSRKKISEKIIDRLLRDNFRERFDVTFDFLNDLEGKTLLDMGCGPGFFLLEALRRNVKSATGVDPSQKMLAVARKKIKQQLPRLKNWKLLEGSLDNFESDTKFDVVLAIGLMDYTGIRALKKLSALARSVLILTFPHPWALRVPLRWSWLVLNGITPHYYQKDQIRKNLEACGLSVISFRRLGPIYWVAAAPLNP